MTPEQLERLVTTMGYQLVHAPHARRYYVMQAKDIVERSENDERKKVVQEGSIPFAIISEYATKHTSPERITEFLTQLEKVWGQYRVTDEPFDTTQDYSIGLPTEQVLPEWHGWPIEKVRELLDIAKTKEEGEE